MSLEIKLSFLRNYDEWGLSPAAIPAEFQPRSPSQPCGSAEGDENAPSPGPEY